MHRKCTDAQMCTDKLIKTSPPYFYIVTVGGVKGNMCAICASVQNRQNRKKSMTILENAYRFVNAGIGVIPIENRGKRPLFSMLPRDTEDEPTWEPYKTQLPTAQEMNAWFSNTDNYGVVCGWQGLVVLDFDDVDKYHTWSFWASKKGGIARWVANNAFRVSTSRGGHVYIRLPYHEKNRKLDKIDIKADGYVLGPGSIHPTGIQYRALRSVLSIPLVDALSDVLPAELLVQQQQSTPAAAPASVWNVGPTAPAIGANLTKKIKSAFRIEDFFPGATSSKGDWILTCCPLHDDHKPSFWINTKQQICGCFAGCNEKPMDVINLYARLHGLSNSDAIRTMANRM